MSRGTSDKPVKPLRLGEKKNNYGAPPASQPHLKPYSAHWNTESNKELQYSAQFSIEETNKWQWKHGEKFAEDTKIDRMIGWNHNQGERDRL